MTSKAYITFSNNSLVENNPQLKEFIQNHQGKFITLLLDGNVYAIIKENQNKDISYENVRNIAGSIARELSGRKIPSAVLEGAVLENGFSKLDKGKSVCAFIEGWELGSYQFLNYKSDKNSFKTKLELIDCEDVQASVKEGEARAKAVAYSRDLMNEIPSTLNPETYPEVLEKEFKNTDAKVQILRKKQLEEGQMNGVLAVCRGSKYEPSFVEISYCTDKTKPHVVLVGKGVTFDTGGISLKRGADISDMKMDMGGSAAVAGAMKLLVDMKASVNVTALIPIVENMPDSHSFLPSEVIHYKNGLTVHVGNTDAEGRLILADGLIRAGELNADYIVDIATLTGAIGNALGSKMAGVFGDEELADEMKKIGRENGDYVWPMPLVDAYDSYLNSDYADLCNISSRAEAGSITAGLFLRRFVPKSSKWLHVDMAGVMASNRATGYYSKSATGFGARLLADFTTHVSK
ncbi:leucyl aminopeptidase family protein [Bacillus sp. FJAT-49732]|uniref:Probable cytosol aminopeptidase n=1 Tax=Lederbergia citrisecunda TaxID=2833583 RepID=A0A942TNY8_9BACI|nr:leucyl aminopeptidase family protein [Lederbergia citrisecunda]MBS4200848.1 leucyl aminopeptidase family protein [Lederbergia citrisecunda]